MWIKTSRGWHTDLCSRKSFKSKWDESFWSHLQFRLTLYTVSQTPSGIVLMINVSVSSLCVTDWCFLQAKLMDYITCSHGYLECWSHSRVSLQGGREGKWDHLRQINESLTHYTHAYPLGEKWLFAYLTVTSLHIWDLNAHSTYCFWIKGGNFFTNPFILRLLILQDIKSQIANVVYARNIVELSHLNKKGPSHTHAHTFT